MYVLLAFLFFSTSVKADSLAADDLYLRWLSVKEAIPNIKLKQGESILSPKGTDIKVIELILYNQKFNLIKDCVFYRIPSASGTGKIYIHTVNVEDDCSLKILEKSNRELKSIYNFGFKLEDQLLSFAIDEKSFEFNLLNLKNKSLIKLSYAPEESTYRLKDGDKCYQVNDRCEVTMFNRCSLCPSSYLNIVSASCPYDYSKVCSDKACGQKDGPACIRGYKATGFSENYCLNDSPIAYCRGDLRVFCIEDELRCK